MIVPPCPAAQKQDRTQEICSAITNLRGVLMSDNSNLSFLPVASLNLLRYTPLTSDTGCSGSIHEWCDGVTCDTKSFG